MSFAAKYPGHCNAEDCAYGDHRINEGDSVVYVDDELVHEACRSRYRDDTPTCGECGLQHRGEC